MQHADLIGIWQDESEVGPEQFSISETRAVPSRRGRIVGKLELLGQSMAASMYIRAHCDTCGHFV